MHDQHLVTTNHVTQLDTGVSDNNRQIAQQDAVIVAITHRLAVASAPRIRYSFRALFNQYSIEAELATARETRGALLHDRHLVQARG
jgi:hypothetical protein